MARIVTSLALFSALCLTAVATAAQTQQKQVEALPSAVEWLNQPAVFKVNGNDSLSITSSKNTDWFASPLDESLTATSPKMLFLPDEEFVLSAKVTPDFRSKWDAGVLVVYLDERNWAKLCFEMTVDGRPSIDTVVTHGTSDDSVSMAITTPSVYLKIAKLGKVVLFYVSPDGRSWQMVRAFRMENVSGLRAGFSSQSPTGEGCRTEFSEIKYLKKRIADVFTGE